MTTSAAPGPERILVRCESTQESAIAVCVGGTFNKWQFEAKTLHPARGRALAEGIRLAPVTCKSRLVVDGQWMPDPWPERPCPTRWAGVTRF